MLRGLVQVPLFDEAQTAIFTSLRLVQIPGVDVDVLDRVAQRATSTVTGGNVAVDLDYRNLRDAVDRITHLLVGVGVEVGVAGRCGEANATLHCCDSGACHAQRGASLRRHQANCRNCTSTRCLHPGKLGSLTSHKTRQDTTGNTEKNNPFNALFPSRSQRDCARSV
eukprot:INCI19794.1.p1 GENE.INCI19794.1~~INCI19794.1.p1  ORF type:complete len:167 (+),score=17.70 INCI19794.1:84-584(+)